MKLSEVYGNQALLSGVEDPVILLSGFELTFIPLEGLRFRLYPLYLEHE